MNLLVELRGRVDTFALDVAFECPAGVTALFGPSGAGKSLTLRHVAGLARAEAGRVVLGDRVLFDHASGIHVHPRERRIGMVFQDYALFPHMSVGANVAYGLHHLARAERAARVSALLALMGLEGTEKRDPGSLSGGERQRVALARALAPEPDLLLLDEPFAALDLRVRRELRRAFAAIQCRTGVPMLLVTHSLAEARELSGTLVLLDRGRVLAAGPTEATLADPGSAEASSLLAFEELR